MQIDAWEGCYKDGWGHLLLQASYAHPAKYSKTLIFRIIDHALEEGWLTPGSTCFDVFAGIGSGALPTLLQGVNWVGIELEPRFVALAEQNLAYWRQRYGHRMQGAEARVIQGDAREVVRLLQGQIGCCVSSPPYAQSFHGQDEETPIQERIARTSQSRTSGTTGRNSQINHPRGYGDSPQNLGNLPTGSLDAAIASPPYATGCTHTGGPDPQPQHITGGPLRYVAYGDTTGNLGAMAVEAVVSSPPYERSLQNGSEASKWALLEACERDGHGHAVGRKDPSIGKDYGEPPAQLGNTQGDTFWAAARQVVAGVFAVLKPGGTAIWVTKNYIRDKTIVPFTDDWIRLCLSVGFEVLHHHKALLVEQHSIQRSLFGDDTIQETRRESFFRRLARKKSGLAIVHEDVLCMRKSPCNPYYEQQKTRR